MSSADADTVKQKSHRERNAGRKAEKKKAKKEHVQELTDKQRNPKAFTFNSAIKAERRFRRKEDITTKKQHIPVVDRTPLDPPPFLVAVVGPPKVGKTTLIQCLVKSYTKQRLTNVVGPVTVIASKKTRITFMECKNDLNSMIDIAKVADLVLLLIDASFGFEMEMFEFLNICQTHGMPRVMGVLTHMDLIKNAKDVKNTKKVLKQRFWKEVFPGAKLMYLSGMLHNEYLKNEMKNLTRFISVIKTRPLSWRTSHPYLLVDRIEDMTDPELLRQNAKINRKVVFYGYVRGVPLHKGATIHIPGCGDFKIASISFLPDPCPFPDKIKNRSLNDKERNLYAPFAGIGRIVFEKDGIFIELGGSHSHNADEDTGLVTSILETQSTLDKKLEQSELKLFSNAVPIKTQDVDKNFGGLLTVKNIEDSGRVRRKVEPFDVKSQTVNMNEEQISDEEDDDMTFEDNEETENFTATEQNHSFNQDSDGSPENSEDEIEESDECSEEDEKDDSQLGQKRKQAAEKDDSLNKKRKLFVCKSNSDDESDKLATKNIKGKNNKVEMYHEPSKGVDYKVKSKIANALSSLEEYTKHKEEIEEKDKHSIVDDNESFDELDENDEHSYDENFTLQLEHDGNGDEQFDADEDEEDDEDQNEDEEEEDEDDEDEVGDEMKWRSNLAERARNAFLSRSSDSKSIFKLIYGAVDGERSCQKKDDEKEENEEDIIGGIFRVSTEENKKKLHDKEKKNAAESVFLPSNLIMDCQDETCSIHNESRFVTGKWKDSEDAEELLKLDNMDDEVFDYFEDMETGEKHDAKNKVDQRVKEKHPEELTIDEMDEKRKLIEKKKQLKEKFDAEYDGDEKTSYYDNLKAKAEQQAQINKSEFDNMDDDIRVQIEGFRAGMYVRIEVENVPCELIENFDPTYPLIIGGLLPGEEIVSFVQARLKKHRWYDKILKTRDPVILSVGWRRFQTMVVYSKLEDNMRLRMLKYTPEHISCMANFWGPIVPQGAGILAVQFVDSRKSGFRIAATGTIVEMDKTCKVVKKLKLTGVPVKIVKNTAFIKDMFSSPLEVAKFEGAKIKTVSGIRGQIKKALSNNTMQDRFPKGSFRATFEDKIKLSDIVFCRTWYRVEIPKFYTVVTNLLLPPNEKSDWRGMRTVGELKYERNIKALPNKDSLYTLVEREEKVFKPLMIPKKLQKDLPYRDKPKMQIPKNKRRPTFSEKRVAVVRDPQEQKTAQMIKMIRANYAHKQEKNKEAIHKRMSEYQARVEEATAKTMKHVKRAKKEECRRKSKSKKNDRV